MQLSNAGHEALDDPETSPILVKRMLREIAIANRWFGGRRAVAIGLRHLLKAQVTPQRITLLDVGTGAGDLPKWVVHWARRRNFRVRAFGLERSRAAGHLASSGGLPLILGSGESLPLRNQSVDIVLLSQLAHHFDDESVKQLLIEASRVARIGVVVAELRPSWAAGIAYRFAGKVLGFHEVTIEDGVTSLERGFSRKRIRRLANEAGAHQVYIRTSIFARITASWRTEGI